MSEEAGSPRDIDCFAPPIRASFSMGRTNRDAVKWVAERYHVDQGDVVDMAPVLFAIFAEQVLHYRRQELVQLKKQADHASRGLDQMAKAMPHLRRWAVGIKQAIQQLIEMEERAIEDRDLSTGDSLQPRPGQLILNSVGADIHEIDGDSTTFDFEEHNPAAPVLAEMVARAGGQVIYDQLDSDGKPMAPYSMMLDFGEGDGQRRIVVKPATGFCAITDRSIDDLVRDPVSGFGRVGP
jgi:hypothetical protein